MASALLAPAARAVGVPAMGSDVFYYHGYAELFLGDRWVKATPAFDRARGERFGVHAPRVRRRHRFALPAR